jgi:hypothetical protein
MEAIAALSPDAKPTNCRVRISGNWKADDGWSTWQKWKHCLLSECPDCGAELGRTDATKLAYFDEDGPSSLENDKLFQTCPCGSTFTRHSDHDSGTAEFLFERRKYAQDGVLGDAR